MQPATLCFIRDGDRLLLIEKKRGVGEGLWNGPGGKVEDSDDSIRDAAIRETEEETGVTPLDVEKRGENRFFFGGDPFMHVHIYYADDYTGQPRECAEARPEWHRIEAIPYENMWPDDRIWLPAFLAGKQFHGTFHFDADSDTLQDWELLTR